MDDLISRQAAIDALWKALYEYEDKTEKQFQESEDLDVRVWIGHRIFVQNMNDIDRQTILNLPSVQPERKEGKWYFRDTTRYGKLPYICTVCGREANDVYDFCPNCGADMRVEE